MVPKSTISKFLLKSLFVVYPVAGLFFLFSPKAKEKINPTENKPVREEKNIRIESWDQEWQGKEITVVHLTWSTREDVTVSKYTVEKSEDEGNTYKSLNTAETNKVADVMKLQRGGYNSDNTILYSTEGEKAGYIYNDILPKIPSQAVPDIRYRVKTETADGKVIYSDDISLQNGTHTFKWVPPPTNNNTTVDPRACPGTGSAPNDACGTAGKTTTYSGCCKIETTDYSSCAPHCKGCDCACSCKADPCCIHACADKKDCNCGAWEACGPDKITSVVTSVTPQTPPSLSSTVSSCYDDCSADINLSVSGGSSPYTYSWTDGYTTQDINNVCKSSYTVDVTDDIGCTSTLTVSVPACAAPITLLSFTAELKNKYVYLDWITATESNNDYFTIERSGDGTSFSPILNDIKGAGNSSKTVDYTAIDKNPLYGTSYYRLKQTDFNGSSSYANTIEITVPFTELVSVVPNPTTGAFEVMFSAEKEDVVIKIVDVTGKKVFEKILSGAEGFHRVSVDLSKEANGVYFVSVKTLKGEFNRKIIKHNDK